MLTELSLSLPAVPSTGRAVRAAVRDRFGGVLGRDTIADLELVVSELVTNAIDHGRGAVRLAIEHDGKALRGSVTDEGSGFAYERRAFDGHELRGRGLAIVDALVTRWGIRGGSTHVWFEMMPSGS